LAIVDVGLPDVNGFDLFHEIQAHWRVPGDLPDGEDLGDAAWWELGGRDDYVPKPFSRGLCAGAHRPPPRGRAPATPQRFRSARDHATRRRAFEVDDERKTIRYRGRHLDLSRYEYRLLKLFVERPGRVFSRDDLLVQVWDDPASSFDRTVDAHVKQLRAKLRAIDPEADPIDPPRRLSLARG
jgi:two-component system catabolic regulation response regulator CreB